MRSRQSIPRLWLMTDPRLDNVEGAVARLPRGSGVVVRHYDLPGVERRRLFLRIVAIARRRGHVVLLAAPPLVARAWGAHGAHHRSALRSCGLRSVAVHNPGELELAKRVGADIVFVSPVFATRSHPGMRPLGSIRAARMITQARGQHPVALGGMTRTTFKRLRSTRVHGWAAIDAFRT